MNDLELLQRYASENSQDAFAELVQRHLGLVYSVALRQVKSPQSAEEVAQSVFTTLARNADNLKPGTLLAGWLYRVTRRAAVDLMRGESRRHLREQTAAELAQMKSDASDWNQIEPLLDEALESLDEADRNAILLRFFESKSLREVGESLGTSEDAAQKRVSRAVAELRACFSRRGMAVASASVAALLAAHSAQAAPSGLGETIAAASAARAASQAAAIAVVKGIAMTTMQKTLIAATLLAAVSASFYEAHRASEMQDQVQILQRRQSDELLKAAVQNAARPRPSTAPTGPTLPSADAAAQGFRVAKLWASLQNSPGMKLSAAQMESYLKENKRSAGSLLAAFRATGDQTLLQEVMEKYPKDPQVDFAAAFKTNASPEERRQWLDAFKQSAPDNAVANYLSALDYFNTGQPGQAVQELTAAAGKPQFQDYSTEFVQNGEEAYLAAGYSPAEAETLATTQLLLPQLLQMKQLNQSMVDLASSYRQAGDAASAQSVLQMDVQLGQHFDGAPGEAVISTLVGLAIQKNALNAMDPSAPYGPSGQTVSDQINQLKQQGDALNALAQQAESLLPTMPDDEWISYKNRWMLFGEENALHWVVDKYGNP